ncbi:hypothetical protein ZYGR_0A00230 [Zygosaccharomyces rouxii]|uniref:Endoplasmic oxidoreductin-1 n=1 Tax=Zygosaccharomyces rouxii TaxID=4956 RepID=A0A1Q2ZSG9_ZYGRO|nr:hypothetical protein ZYGR_0A00230 [Zygosaccharomyces rouxii]
MKAGSSLLSLVSLLAVGSRAQNVTENNLEPRSISFGGNTSVVPSAVPPPVPPPLNSTYFCTIDKGEVINPTCDVTFDEINEINGKIRKDLVSLVHTDFFKYFRLHLYKQCPFWNQNNGFCVNRACAVDVVEDWDSLPECWQPEVLGGLQENETISDEESVKEDCKFLDDLCANNKKQRMIEPDIEYCDINDLHGEGSVLVDLTANPERFTGYGGQESSQIWSSIYGENCFSQGETGQSLAKDAFYRLVSGLHASIGTHLSNDHLNTETGKWGPDLDLFMARVGNFPDRVSNMYFNYAVVSKALWKIKPYLDHLKFCDSYDPSVKATIMNILSQLDSKVFNENLIFEGELSSKLKDDFRIRFKNVTQIMDCVHCDRCRMWGKVQTTGYATSLKILFELDESNENSKQHVVDKLTKYELIALFNTFDRLSKSIESVNNFEKMYNVRLEGGKIASFFKQNNFFKLLGRASRSISESVQSISKSIDQVSESQKPSGPVFADLKLPETNSKGSDEPKTNVWVKAWHTEIHNVCEAFKFIFRSYLDLPRNLYTLVLSVVNSMWNSFVGARYWNWEEENPVVYNLNTW